MGFPGIIKAGKDLGASAASGWLAAPQNREAISPCPPRGWARDAELRSAVEPHRPLA